MSITLNELYNYKNNKYSLSNHTNQSLLKKTVSWVYLLEDLKNINFIRNGELVITTGMQMHNSEDIFHLIDILVDKNCSGLIINTGRYVLEDHITDEICEYANKLNFPLLSMPWKIHIAEIMQDFCMMLSQQALVDNTLAMSFKNAIISPEYTDGYIPTITQYGYEQNAKYKVVAISSNISYEMTKNYILSILSRCNIVYHNNCTILILYENQIKDFDTILPTIISNKNIEHIGIGSSITSLNKIYESYRQALFANKICKSSKNKYEYFYKLDVYRLFYEIKDISILEKIATNILNPIIEYDKIHNSEYYITLKIYLEHSSSILEVANITNVHRNTINYRIRKIKELLKNDLTDANYIFRLMFAYNIMDYIDIIKGDSE